VKLKANIFQSILMKSSNLHISLNTKDFDIDNFLIDPQMCYETLYCKFGNCVLPLIKDLVTKSKNVKFWSSYSSIEMMIKFDNNFKFKEIDLQSVIKNERTLGVDNKLKNKKTNEHKVQSKISDRYSNRYNNLKLLSKSHDNLKKLELLNNEYNFLTEQNIIWSSNVQSTIKYLDTLKSSSLFCKIVYNYLQSEITKYGRLETKSDRLGIKSKFSFLDKHLLCFSNPLEILSAIDPLSENPGVWVNWFKQISHLNLTNLTFNFYLTTEHVNLFVKENIPFKLKYWKNVNFDFVHLIINNKTNPNLLYNLRFLLKNINPLKTTRLYKQILSKAMVSDKTLLKEDLYFCEEDKKELCFLYYSFCLEYKTDFLLCLVPKQHYLLMIDTVVNTFKSFSNSPSNSKLIISKEISFKYLSYVIENIDIYLDYIPKLIDICELEKELDFVRGTSKSILYLLKVGFRIRNILILDDLGNENTMTMLSKKCDGMFVSTSV
jgi:hypothetical protein